MTDLDLMLAIAGFAVTALVVAGMILITPRGQVEVVPEGDDPQGSELSPVGRTEPVRQGGSPATTEAAG